MSELTQFHVRRFEQLRADRTNFDSQWEDAAALLVPSHRDMFSAMNSGVPGQQGQKKTDRQFDSRASFAALRFASVMESITTPQGSIWHILRVLDRNLRENKAVRMFFDELSETLYNYRYRPAANFVANSQQVYHSLGVYGNGILYVDTPDDGAGLRYRNVFLGEAYFADNHAGVIDTVYRQFYMTVRQIAQRWGGAAPQAVRELAKDPNQSEAKKLILHCVYPRDDYDPERVDPKGKKYASLYIYKETSDLLGEGGYDSFPYAISRYTQSSGEVYGRGPAQWVLPAIKTLNEEKRTLLKVGHREADPVLLAHDDGTLGTISIRPGALNAGGVNKDGRPLIHKLPTGNIPVNEKMMDIEMSVINDAFLNTLFQILVDTPQMTATEVIERAKEKGMLLAPTAGRMHAEFLGPLIEREILLLARQGLLPRVPPMLQDAAVEYRIEYDNPISRMAKSEKAAGFMRALDVAANYTKMTGDAEPLDWFDIDTAMPAIIEINGAPAAWVRSMEQVSARRDERATAMQSQQAIEAAPAVASTVKTLAG